MGKFQKSETVRRQHCESFDNSASLRRHGLAGNHSELNSPSFLRLFNFCSSKPMLSVFKLIFELHQLPGKANRSWDEEYAIKMIYFNETFSPIDGKPYVLRIPVCSGDDLCTVKQFFTFISDYTLDFGAQWIKLCYLGSSTNSHASSATEQTFYLFWSLVFLQLLLTIRSSSMNSQ